MAEGWRTYLGAELTLALHFPLSSLTSPTLSVLTLCLFYYLRDLFFPHRKSCCCWGSSVSFTELQRDGLNLAEDHPHPHHHHQSEQLQEQQRSHSFTWSKICPAFMFLLFHPDQTSHYVTMSCNLSHHQPSNQTNLSPNHQTNWLPSKINCKSNCSRTVVWQNLNYMFIF